MDAPDSAGLSCRCSCPRCLALCSCWRSGGARDERCAPPLGTDAVNHDIEIQLSERSDGLGFYGTAWVGDAVVRVKVLPPEYLWPGDIRLDDARPDSTHW